MEAFWIRFLPLYENFWRSSAPASTVSCVTRAATTASLPEAPAASANSSPSWAEARLLDIGIYNLGFLHMIMGSEPETFATEVHFNEFETDDFSVLQLTCPGGRSENLQAGL